MLLELGLNGGASRIFSYTDVGMTLTCEPVSILKRMSFPVLVVMTVNAMSWCSTPLVIASMNSGGSSSLSMLYTTFGLLGHIFAQWLSLWQPLHSWPNAGHSLRLCCPPQFWQSMTSWCLYCILLSSWRFCCLGACCLFCFFQRSHEHEFDMLFKILPLFF